MQEECPTCDGTGTITTDEHDPRDPLGHGQITINCPTCRLN